MGIYEGKSIKELADIAQCSYSAMRERINKKGFAAEEAVSLGKLARGGQEKIITAFGQSNTLKDWSKELDIDYKLLKHRAWRVGIEEALTMPKNRNINTSKKVRTGPREERNLPKGFYFDGPYNLVCPDGSILSGLSKNKSHYPKPMSGECIECGSLLYWDLLRRGKNNPKQFCNKSCSCIHRNKKMAGVPRQKLYDNVEAKCMGCGIEFISDWIGGSGYRQYCNNDCLNKNHKPIKPLGDRPLSQFGLYVGAVKTNWSEFNQRECISCGSLTTKHRYSVGGSRHCSIECQDQSTIESKRKARRKQGRYSHIKRAKAAGADWEYGVTLQAVAKRDNMQCQICGCKVHRHRGPKHGWQPRSWSIDHIVAINGPGKGSHTWDNVQLACMECNTMKGTKDMDEVAA